MFFEASEPFARVIAEFELVEREFSGWKGWEERDKIDLELHMSSLLMRKGNCYLPKRIRWPYRARYHEEESAVQALAIYEKAQEFAKKTVGHTAKPLLTEVFVRFSLLQSLRAAGRADWEARRVDSMFEEVIHDIRKHVATKTEPILLALLNYVLAICVREISLAGESASFYLARTREYLQHVPNEVRVFSPISKINLAREDILQELDDFESMR
jgi:hypothetical protein